MPPQPATEARLTAADPDSGGSRVCAWWSFTKTAIAVCALGLAERGEFDLDEPLPGRPCTLRQVLAHTSGLADYGQLPPYHRAVAANDPPWSRDRMLATVTKLGPLFAPGAGWSYSNVGYMLARERVEAAAGRAFGALFAERVAGPLGLASVTMVETPDDVARLAWATPYHPGWVCHGLLAGTPRDAARLLQAVLGGEVLGAGALAAMLAAHPLPHAGPHRPWIACGYGLGLMIGAMKGVGRAIGHTGGGPFSTAAVYHFPDLPDAPTVACFAPGQEAGETESKAAALARQI